jgi:hypothetical protein
VYLPVAGKNRCLYKGEGSTRNLRISPVKTGKNTEKEIRPWKII